MQITVTNHLGKSLLLDNLKFPVVSMDGLTPSAAIINTSGAATADGTFFNSSYVGSRNIVLTVVPNGEAEKARIKLYEYFKPKHKVTLNFKTKYRDVYIDGYVENFEGGLYETRQSFQISILCPQPFFNDVNTQIVIQRTVVDAFSFPFSTPEGGIPLSNFESNIETSVVNKGEESTGVVIKMIANDTVLEPTIYNKTTRETFTIQIEMTKGDTIVIDTRRGHKTITLTNEGIEKNILNKIAKGSKWFQLVTGENILTFDTLYGANNLSIEYGLNALYGGL